MRSILFRVEASSSVGMGHLSRTRTLARHLSTLGHRSFLMGPLAAYRQADDDDLFADWVEAPEWIAGEAGAVAQLDAVRDMDASRVVFDDYRVDPEFGATLADAGVVFMQQFDSSKPRDYWADMIAHGGLAEADKAVFGPHLRRSGAEMLFGPSFAVLRPSFPPPRQTPGRQFSQVLVSFGGGDDKGAVEFTLETLITAARDGFRFAIMSGKANPNNPEIADWIAQRGHGLVDLHIDPPDVAWLFGMSDLAILGGGTSTFEAASTGLPMILMALAPNQARQCEVWRDLGAAVYLGRLGDVEAGALSAAFRALQSDPGRREVMAGVGRTAVDGRGAERLIAHLLKDRP